MTTKNNKTRTLRVSSNVEVLLRGVLITRFTDDEFGRIRQLFATELNDGEQVLLNKLVSTNILALLFKVYEQTKPQDVSQSDSNRKGKGKNSKSQRAKWNISMILYNWSVSTFTEQVAPREDSENVDKAIKRYHASFI